MRLINSLLFAACLLLTTQATAQLRMPAASPSAKLETQIGLTDVTVEYSRPQKRDRDIFGGLVPYGEVWRTGANQATKVTFGGDVSIEGTELTAGSYAVLTKPMKDEWEVMFFPYEGGNWGSYVEKEPAATVTVETMDSDADLEAFTIEVDNYTTDGAHLTMAWADTKVAVPVTTTTSADVMASIDRVMAGPGANDYFNAAGFLAEENRDAKKAMQYINKAVEMTSDKPRFWFLRRQAEIYAQNGMKSEAVATAKKSMELAREAGNMDYVRLNQNIIDANMK